jgi:hypothetical protein
MFVPELLVVGLLATSGASACKNVTEFESEEYPIEFLASIMI